MDRSEKIIRSFRSKYESMTQPEREQYLKAMGLVYQKNAAPADHRRVGFGGYSPSGYKPGKVAARVQSQRHLPNGRITGFSSRMKKKAASKLKLKKNA